MKKYLVLSRNVATEKHPNYGKMEGKYISLIGKISSDPEVYLADDPMHMTIEEIHKVLPTQGIAFRNGYSSRKMAADLAKSLNSSGSSTMASMWNSTYELFPVELD